MAHSIKKHQGKQRQGPLVIFIDDPRAENPNLVGGKAASLARLYKLKEKGIHVPPLYSVTTTGYSLFLEANPKVAKKIKTLDKMSLQLTAARQQKSSTKTLEARIRTAAEKIEGLMATAILPNELVQQVRAGYKKLGKEVQEKNPAIAVRSSGVAEDLPGASFAGQYETKLNQRGFDEVVESIRNCFASNFAPRVVTYRNDELFKLVTRNTEESPFLHEHSKIATANQYMVNAKAAGVAFSLDPVHGAPITTIEAVYGLGEGLVGGGTTADTFGVDQQGRMIEKCRGSKQFQVVYAESGTQKIETNKTQRQSFSLTDKQVQEIAKGVKIIQEEYGRPVDTEFAIDQNGKVWFLQARPETIHSEKDLNIIPMRQKAVDPSALQDAEIIGTTGVTGSPGAASGRIIAAETVEEALTKLHAVTNDQNIILVAQETTPDWMEIIQRVKAIVTEQGSKTCHAAIVSREKRTPALVGIGHELYTKLKALDGQEITIQANEEPAIYKGILPLKEVGQDIDLQELKQNLTRTKVGLILGSPDEAKRMHALRELGPDFLISLLRVEFILASHIGVHARALEDYDDKAKKAAMDHELRHKIKAKIAGYKSGKAYYIAKLAEGISSFASLFPDSEITIRTTDFKTNEYSNLLGGTTYETKEANPMMGWRGLIRSLAPENHEVTRWELEALKKVQKNGYTNIKVMFPVVRDPQELTGGPELDTLGFKGIFELMDEVKLERGKYGIKTGIMVEDPANVVRFDEFADTGIDFISFGTNDLTQFTLVADRDSGRLGQIPWLSERNPAVIEQLRAVIQKCRERGIEAGSCGNGPSNYPELAEMMVEEGITSIGVMPDRYLDTHMRIRQVEKTDNARIRQDQTVVFSQV